MSFNVQCVFSGLCAYVPNARLEPESTMATKMAVLMVDARKPRRARDGKKLQPHFPLLMVDAKFVPATNLPPDTRIVWPLDRLALRFEAGGGTPGGLSIALSGRKEDTDFLWVPGMDEAAPDFTSVDPKCFENSGSKDLISARLILDRGHLRAYDFRPKDIPTFDFEAVLNSKMQPRKMSNRVSLSYDNVRSFSIIWSDLDGDGTEKKFDLEAKQGQSFSLDVGNFCDGCLPRRSVGNPVKGPFKDVDFRWYYELCADRGSIKIPTDKFLPIPESDGGGGPGAIQCMGGRFAAFQF